MKISQKDVILIKIFLSKWYGARRTLSEFPDKGWKVGSNDSVLKRIHKTVIIVRQRGSGRPHIRCVAVEDFMLSQKGTNQLVRFCMTLPFSVQVCIG